MLKRQITKVDYLTIVMCPDEMARAKMEAKLLWGNGDYKTYKEAYNAVLCADVLECAGNAMQPADDLEFEQDFLLFAEQSHHADLQFARKVQQLDKPEDRNSYLKTVVRHTKKYKALTRLIENDLNTFMSLLNTEVATKADRYSPDLEPWSYKENPGGLFTYEKSATLFRHGVSSGQIAWGANNGGCMISFGGVGCAGIDIPKLHSMLKKMPNIKITRLDIAYDDYEGKRTVEDYHRYMLEGGFCKKNQPPKFSYIQTGELQMLTQEQQDAWRKKHGWQKRYDAVANGGNTLYVGSRKNGKLFRAYEKGKQMESTTQQNWVRAELELRAIDRVIPLDALLNTDAIFANSYPCLSFISDEKFDIPLNPRALEGRLHHERLSVYHAKSYGKHANFMRHILQLDDSQIVDLLTAGLEPWEIPESINMALVQPPNSNPMEQIQ
ncbi:replication initiation factor domain-containing protein [Pseudoalteromonas ruthenica]|uniref:replication initiation factor domain-containing protein n=1 Tax=Pseudoalteromonas ruthenica TaxID=151081 RepID=UPI00124472D7|nr:replication initiation factor domain-containing protein [Pseudoalteromonas ruthenica]